MCETGLNLSFAVEVRESGSGALLECAGSVARGTNGRGRVELGVTCFVRDGWDVTGGMSRPTSMSRFV